MEKNLYEGYFKDYSTALYDCGNRLKRRHIKNLLPRLEGRKVLDVGAGSGDIRNDLILNHGASAKNYLSVDISRQTLSLAERLAEDTGTTPFISKIADAQSLTVTTGGPFDVIICSEVLEHLPDDKGALRSMSALLEKDGVILITVPYLGEPVEQWGHLRHYSLESFSAMVSDAGLRISMIIYSGRFHNLTWVYLKIFFASTWWGFRKVTGMMKNVSYMASPLHRRLVMPLIDRLLLLDSFFDKKPDSLIGGQATIIAVLKPAG
jgi:ubiquinone/menaquinone biosynthesis C-methylase UbiE